MNSEHERVCPLAKAPHLDNRLRRWLQNPYKILRPFISEGMIALDVGCGPGFFTIPMAQLVGPSGKVFAVDLQEGLLQLLRQKIAGTELEQRIILHHCGVNGLGIVEPVDFALLFYMVHEVPEKHFFFADLATTLKPSGVAMIVEPPFHVPRAAFARTLDTAATAGFLVVRGPRVALSKTAVLHRSHVTPSRGG